LTTQEAANLLNVSREHVRQLIRDGKLPSVDVGRHHRIRFSDLMVYRNGRDTERRRALDAITDVGVEAGGYFED
jgi:excisionase family DNA binding protein